MYTACKILVNHMSQAGRRSHYWCALHVLQWLFETRWVTSIWEQREAQHLAHTPNVLVEYSCLTDSESCSSVCSVSSMSSVSSMTMFCDFSMLVRSCSPSPHKMSSVDSNFSSSSSSSSSFSIFSKASSLSSCKIFEISYVQSKNAQKFPM